MKIMMKNKCLNRQFALLLRPDEIERLTKKRLLSIIEKSYFLIFANALFPVFCFGSIGPSFFEKVVSVGFGCMMGGLTAIATFLLIWLVDRLTHRCMGLSEGMAICGSLSNKDKLEVVNKLENLKDSLDPTLFAKLVSLLNQEGVGKKWWVQLQHALADFDLAYEREKSAEALVKKKPPLQKEEDRFDEKIKTLTALALEHQKEKVLPSILSTEKLDVK